MLAFAAIFLAAGCGKDEKKETQQTDSNTVLLYDFEDYKTNVEPLILLNYFGKVSLNTEKEYVKNGNGSLKMIPEGCISEDSTLAPTLKAPLNIDVADVQENDISQLVQISAEVYNASDSEITMRTQLQFFQGAVTNDQSHTLKKGWNTVIIKLDTQVVDLSYDIKDCKGILFAFPLLEQAPTLYMDDIYLYKTDVPFKPMDTTLDPFEICSFDKLYQQYVVMPYMNVEKAAAQLSINTDLTYVISGKSLKVQMKGNDGSFQVGDSSSYTYTGFSISANFMSKVNMEQYTDDMYFSFWVYNAGSSQQRLFIHFYNQEGAVYASVKDIYVPAGEWLNVKRPLSSLSQGTSSTSYKNAGEIYINWEVNTLMEDRVLYFDEFKVTEE